MKLFDEKLAEGGDQLQAVSQFKEISNGLVVCSHGRCRIVSIVVSTEMSTLRRLNA